MSNRDPALVKLQVLIKKFTYLRQTLSSYGFSQSQIEKYFISVFFDASPETSKLPKLIEELPFNKDKLNHVFKVADQEEMTFKFWEEKEKTLIPEEKVMLKQKGLKEKKKRNQKKKLKKNEEELLQERFLMEKRKLLAMRAHQSQRKMEVLKKMYEVQLLSEIRNSILQDQHESPLFSFQTVF